MARAHDLLLQFFVADDPNVTRRPAWSFECGAVAMLDWLHGIRSEYAGVIEEALTKGEF